MDLKDFTVIDYETRDFCIEKSMGGGWAYAICYPEVSKSFSVGLGVLRSKLLGTYPDAPAYTYYHNNMSGYTDTSQFNIEHRENVLVGHNLIYDLGWYLKDHCNNKDQAVHTLRDMYKSGLLLVDTIILARLADEFQMSYSLKNLALYYNVHQKSTDKLADAVFNTGLYTDVKSTENRKFVNRPSNNSVLLSIAYKNMDKLPVDVVKEYCIDDIIATKELYLKLLEILLDEYGQDKLFTVLKKYSDLQYCVTEMRLDGISIDNQVLRSNHSKLCQIIKDVQNDLNELVGGMSVNVSATSSLVDACRIYGYDEDSIPKTDNGNYSITQQWLESQNNELCKKILSVRKLQKIISTFIESIMSIQDELHLSFSSEGKVHTEFNIFGAHTGRFSSANPNVQQIPKRDKEFNKICRGMFIAGEGRKFISADYSNQEQRIQVHYGKLLKAKGADEIAAAWTQDENLDFHQKVADIVGIDRRLAKTINLGKSYGMGEAKLCHSLGLPTKIVKKKHYGKIQEMEVAGEAGKDIINKYNEMFPFLSEATEMCRAVMQKRGYLRSLGGRHIHPEKITDNGKPKLKYFKAFSQLIQGSAADQLIQTMVDYYKYAVNEDSIGLKLVGVVHDEMLFTVEESNSDEAQTIVNDLMSKSIKLEVPMTTSIHVGDSWYAED